MDNQKVGKFFEDMNIRFTLGDIDFIVLKVAFELYHRSIPSHSHSSNSYEIHYIPYGRGHITLDHISYEVTPNTLYVTGPHVEHSQIPVKDDPMAEYCIYLKIDSVTDGRKKPKLKNDISSFQDTLSWFGQDTQNLHALMQNIFSELDNKYTGYLPQIQTYLQQLIILMLRNYESHKKDAAYYEPSSVGDSNYLLIEDCFLYEYSDITLERLAARLGLSTRQTERLLLAHYKKTFLQKKTESKMSAASIMLRDYSLSITEIALTLGYSSVEHFSTAFKRYYGVPATSFRKKYRQ